MRALMRAGSLASIASSVPRHEMSNMPRPHWPRLNLIGRPAGMGSMTSFTLLLWVAALWIFSVISP
jgi:hypothetical protein